MWKFWHLVDEKNADQDKTEKLYKVRPLLNSVLAKFKHYYYPAQKISIDEGMIPAKNRLGIKQYIKDKPTKWGIKTFILADSSNGYLYAAEVYCGKLTMDIFQS